MPAPCAASASASVSHNAAGSCTNSGSTTTDSPSRSGLTGTSHGTVESSTGTSESTTTGSPPQRDMTGTIHRTIGSSTGTGGGSTTTGSPPLRDTTGTSTSTSSPQPQLHRQSCTSSPNTVLSTTTNGTTAIAASRRGSRRAHAVASGGKDATDTSSRLPLASVGDGLHPSKLGSAAERHHSSSKSKKSNELREKSRRKSRSKSRGKSHTVSRSVARSRSNSRSGLASRVTGQRRRASKLRDKVSISCAFLVSLRNFPYEACHTTDSMTRSMSFGISRNGSNTSCVKSS